MILKKLKALRKGFAWEYDTIDNDTNAFGQLKDLKNTSKELKRALKWAEIREKRDEVFLKKFKDDDGEEVTVYHLDDGEMDDPRGNSQDDSSSRENRGKHGKKGKKAKKRDNRALEAIQKGEMERKE